MISSTSNPAPHFTRLIHKLQHVRGLSLLAQAAITAFALILAWTLRFDFSLPHSRILFSAMPILMLLRIAAIYRFHLDHGYWRFSGITDALNILKAVSVSSLVFLIVIRYVFGLTAFPLSIYPLELILSAFGLGGSRVMVRSIQIALERRVCTRERLRAVIIGAGFAGQMLVRELHQSNGTHTPIAMLDDDPAKRGAMLHGVRVEADLSQLATVVRKYKADVVLIAIPSATREQMFRIVEVCQKAKIRYLSIPALGDIASGKLRIGDFREIHLQDLLGRDPVELELESVRRLIAQSVVMVTGAAGSIGSELCSQILLFEPKTLICVDHDESGLFNLEQETLSRESTTDVLYCVEDVGDSDRIQALLLQYEVRFIFHAAAYKHVPLMEQNPRKALKNNVFALRRLVDIAEDCGVDSFVLISSDKAVNPTSVMGCTKRIGELILAARSSRRMQCVSVRFGNVLGSQGSVVPLFQQQLRRNKPLTITHPDITRFFMTTCEAVSLVLQAFSVGKNGDILVLDMGEPISILRMAKTLISLSGHSESEVPIMFTGLRPGEKLYEELFYHSEKRLRTELQKILRTQGKMLKWVDLDAKLRRLEFMLDDANDDRLKQAMAEIVPEYEVRLRNCEATLPPLAGVNASSSAGA